MQALWSRAGQVRHCGCKACFNAAGGMMRQSATRATQRKPTFTEMFTACYTSIMGTAAVLDAKRKDERRKDLERQLEEARAEFAKVMENSSADTLETAPAGNIANRYKGALRDHKKQPSEISEFFDSLGRTQTWSRAPPRSPEVEMIWAEYGLEPTRRSMRALARTDYVLLDRLLVEDEAPRNFQHRAPKTLRQMKAAEDNMQQLVSSLLRGKTVTGSGDPKKIRRGLDKVKHDDCDTQHLQQEVAELRQRSYPHYEREVDSGALKKCSADLNRSLRDIFEVAQPSNLRSTIMKVCHNLLVSSQPPTIHTYNTLIKGFDAAGLHPLASSVVKSLFQSKLEPTQGTLVCLLNHFKETNESGNFNNIIERMTGKDCRGMKIRRKPIDDVNVDPKLRRWALSKDVVVTKQYVIERAWFDTQVFAAIVEGMLSFRYLRNAVATVAFGLKMGFTFSLRTMSQLLDQCVRALDPKAALGVLGALATKPKLVEAVFSRECDQTYLAQRIQNLLDICGITGSSPAAVAPFLRDVPALSLPSRRQRRGIDIARMVRLVEQSSVKLEYFETKLSSIRQCLVDPQLGTEARRTFIEQTGYRKHLPKTKETAADVVDVVDDKGVEDLSTSEGAQKMVLRAVSPRKTNPPRTGGNADPWARLKMAGRISTHRAVEAAASAAF
ncbi:pentatricopeptide repeat domain-containing protein [Colletotrichum graminicola]|uniref:Pentatricopeptide repeat domain-containing protein n=1 Tax=Colletotrichum graminicola (strain M1.001 / M2 / FGSC 10212) TaxID=645133 RepID=E3QWG5_COLGM|nr:pentatricopeptide repeat domain-containing protein [Colletotrichum graminicola M1.001]EFQ35203.1 pentatricopeptide repeat domain-containing protein [Colletotrichum graminicola M1.001]WDK09995.1 pentatricopeptide repeat domain-containing protein [Colletotrichum graminicola]